MTTDLLLLLSLILLNGLFAMSEIAIVSAKRARLTQMADEGRAGATQALALAAEPTRFLSSVQVGITSIGILNGAIGEGAISAHVREALLRVPPLAPYAESLSLVVMVVVLTYVSLILGELVPKRLALTHPEAIATLISRPMTALATFGRPIVVLLSVSTDGVLRVLRVRRSKQATVTNEEIKVLLEQGTEEGVFEPTEQQLVTNVLDLDDRQVRAVLTPRSDIVYLNATDHREELSAKLRGQPPSVVPVCEGDLDHVIGVVRTTRVMAHLLQFGEADLRTLAEPALFVPESMSVMRVLEQFRRTHLPIALVVDEYGSIDGLVSMSDVVTSIVGQGAVPPGEESPIVRREDGSLLVDGGLEIDVVERVLETEALLSEDEHQRCHTLGGLAMLALERVPRTGDSFERQGFRFEVVDMDGKRVDRILISAVSRHTPAPPKHP